MHKRFWPFFERVAPRTLREINLRANISEWTYVNNATCISNELYNINHAKNKLHKHYRVFRRDREPSRIPIRTLERLRGKNRKVREFVYKGIRSYTPKSSKVHCYVIVIKKQNKAKFLFKGSGTIHKSLLKLRKRANRYLSLCSPNRLCLNKSQVDAANYCKFICWVLSDMRSWIAWQSFKQSWWVVTSDKLVLLVLVFTVVTFTIVIIYSISWVLSDMRWWITWQRSQRSSWVVTWDKLVLLRSISARILCQFTISFSYYLIKSKNSLWFQRKLQNTTISFFIISSQNTISFFTFTRNTDQNLLVIICSIIHCSSFKKLQVLVKHTDKQKFLRNINFNQSYLSARGDAANKIYPCRLCYSFPFNSQKVIKHFYFNMASGSDCVGAIPTSGSGGLVRPD